MKVTPQVKSSEILEFVKKSIVKGSNPNETTYQYISDGFIPKEPVSGYFNPGELIKIAPQHAAQKLDVII